MTYRVSGAGRFGAISLTIAGIGLLVCWWSFATDKATFYHGYLTSFAFWVSVGLGGLFFTMLHHLANATWSTVLRRMTESIAMTLPVMALFFIPVLAGMHELYHWTHENVISVEKAGYLNIPFFTTRGLVAFAIWSVLAFSLYRLSRRQDGGATAEQTFSMRRISAGGMVLFAFSSSMAAFDWLMSLDPHWYSTIFGVYYFTGSLLSLVSMIVIVISSLRRRGILEKAVTIEHYHDLGKLALGFIIFWAYIGFSQYLIQWYGNIPEETVWYLNRWEGSWKGISFIIMFGHFAIPFVILVFRAVKRSVGFMRLIAIWILIVHFVDMFWLVYPTHLKNGPAFTSHEMAAIIGPLLLIGGAFLWTFWKYLSLGPLVPINDAKLKNSMTFVNQ